MVPQSRPLDPGVVAGSDPQPEESRGRWRWRSGPGGWVVASFPRINLTLLLALFMALVALAIAAPMWMAAPAAAAPDLAWAALVPLFALAEVVVIHLPTKRNAHGHTLREIPAVLGLTFLAPQQYVTAYVAGAVVALVLVARMRGIKLVFNASMFALEAAVGSFVHSQIVGASPALSLVGWVAVLAAVLTTDLISAAAVTAAISLTEGAFDAEIIREALRSGTVAAFINTCVALLVAILIVDRPTALPLLGVVVILLVMTYRVYISLARSHAQTQLLYDVVEQTSSAYSMSDLAHVVLRETTSLMHAERAYLVEVATSTEVRYYTSEDDIKRTVAVGADAPSLWWWSALAGGMVRHEGQGGHHLHRSSRATVDLQHFADARSGLAALLDGGGATPFILVVCDPTFERESFGSDDRQVFEALAAHTGVALGRALSVSDLQNVAAELEVARDAALAASEAKSLFLANMSHEIRTPLTTVLATAELLEDMVVDPAQASLIERMQRQGEALKALVENILDFSRIEAGKLALAPRSLDLHLLVADVVDAYRTRGLVDGPSLEWRVDDQVPRTVEADPVHLAQLLTNLLDNAFKFTAAGRVLLEVSASVQRNTPGVAFAVHDTGIGISSADQDRIFEVFSQVDGSATRRYEGTGLGLAISQRLVHLMGGAISVQSELGAGSTFTVWLPLSALRPIVTPPSVKPRAAAV